MLSEHETQELLEQLKQGVLTGPGGVSELVADAVGHWPILIGGGMCLNMQTVAALELNCQPESIYVTSVQERTISCTALASRYLIVHHLDTGVDGRTLVVAYDGEFSSMLSSLQATDYYPRREYSMSGAGLRDSLMDAANRQSEFSQAIATSVDPGAMANVSATGLSFLGLDSKSLSLAGAWRLQLAYRGIESEFFVGLTNSQCVSPPNESQQTPESFSIAVKPEKICRTSGLNALVAELSEPVVVQFEQTRSHGSDPVANSSQCRDERPLADHEQRGGSASALLVQSMLQLSVDDLYLLLLEAVGQNIELVFRFDLKASSQHDARQLLLEGASHRCLSVNGLPVRCAYLTVCDGKLLFKSHE